MNDKTLIKYTKTDKKKLKIASAKSPNKSKTLQHESKVDTAEKFKLSPVAQKTPKVDAPDKKLPPKNLQLAHNVEILEKSETKSDHRIPTKEPKASKNERPPEKESKDEAKVEPKISHKGLNASKSKSDVKDHLKESKSLIKVESTIKVNGHVNKLEAVVKLNEFDALSMAQAAIKQFGGIQDLGPDLSDLSSVLVVCFAGFEQSIVAQT